MHTARVATRRIRSALGAYGALLDAEVAGPVSGELRWLARTAGGLPRPGGACTPGWLRLVDEEPADLVVGPVRRRIDAAYAARQRRGRRAGAGRPGVTPLPRPSRVPGPAGPRRAVDRPGRTAGARRPSPLVREEWKALRRRVRASAEAEDHDAAVHDARKAAKRLRYVVEALVPVWGSDARNLAESGQADVLDAGRPAGLGGGEAGPGRRSPRRPRRPARTPSPTGACTRVRRPAPGASTVTSTCSGPTSSTGSGCAPGCVDLPRSTTRTPSRASGSHRRTATAQSSIGSLVTCRS